MKTSNVLAISRLLFAGLMAEVAQADIVWQGRRVEAWPQEAMVAKERAASVGSDAEAMASPIGHYPSPKGKIYGLTLLVDFPDQIAPVTTQDVLDYLNKPGFNRDGCQGSVRDFYLDMSKSMVDFENEAFGWYRAKHAKAWYEALPGYTGSDSLLKEMLAYFDPIVDFSRYDNDKDGSTEAVSILYAGPGKTWGQGLWPHAGWAGQTRDGVKVNKYQMSDLPGKFALYVFVHECGHMVFGWPDLYWYGDYCTMANRANDLNPVAINDFFRADQGWIPFVDVSATDTGLFESTNGEKVFRYRNPARADQEGLAWSYLQNTARRSVIKGSGLLLHHYDFSIGGNSSATKLGLRLVHADSLGKGDAEQAQWPSGNDPHAMFQYSTYATYTDALYPSTRWYDGTTTGMAFSAVGKPGMSLGFRLGPPIATSSNSVTLEAEQAQVVSASLRTSNDASGQAYVAGINGSLSKVVFTIDRAKEGPCSLSVRFANGGTRTSSHSLSINGSKDSIQYRTTGAWGRFDSVVILANFRAGRNQIILGKKTDYAELDAIRISPTPKPSSLAPTAQTTHTWMDPAGTIHAPTWMAGGMVEFLDPTGRILFRSPLVAAGAQAIAHRDNSSCGKNSITLYRIRLPGRTAAHDLSIGAPHFRD